MSGALIALRIFSGFWPENSSRVRTLPDVTHNNEVCFRKCVQSRYHSYTNQEITMTKPGQGQPFSHLADLCKATQQTNSQNPEDRPASLLVLDKL